MENVTKMLGEIINDPFWRRMYRKFWSKIYGPAGTIDCGACQKCRRYIKEERKLNMSRPVPLQYVGEKFEESSKRILFVGKEVYGELEQYIDTPQWDPFSYDNIRELYFQQEGDFWKWVVKIAESVFQVGEDSFDRIAWTNLLKCKIYEATPEKSTCIAPKKVIRYCIKEAGWIFKEISVVSPNIVVMLCGRRFGEPFINELKHRYDTCRILEEEPSGKEYFVYLHCGNRQFIITRHPSRCPEDIAEKIIKRIIQKISTRASDALIRSSMDESISSRVSPKTILNSPPR